MLYVFIIMIIIFITRRINLTSSESFFGITYEVIRVKKIHLITLIMSAKKWNLDPTLSLVSKIY